MPGTVSDASLTLSACLRVLIVSGEVAYCITSEDQALSDGAWCPPATAEKFTGSAIGADAPEGNNIAVEVSLTTTAAGFSPLATSSWVICATSVACSFVERGAAGVVGTSEVVAIAGSTLGRLERAPMPLRTY